ncbi:MAG TPA: efflux RND transporter periplasmic adaptor subunit [Acidobacteriaceae bacterium]|jgi:multidrug efflux system membrane fusion protein
MSADRNLDPHYALPSSRGSDATINDPAHMLPEQATVSTGKRGGPLRMIIILLIVLMVVAVIVWRIRTNNANTDTENRRSAAAANRPTPVQVADVQQKTEPVYLTALGTVTAYNTVTLHSRVDGQLLEVNFREGQTVRKGQLLLEIDPRPYQAAVDQAIGTLAKDEANLKNMEAEAQRYTSLYEAGVVSKEQQQLQISNAGQASGSIKVDQAAIEAAKVNLGYTKIYSPIDGVVGLRQVDPGNIVHASDSTGLVVITQEKPIAVVFTLPEDQLPQVQQAMRGGNKLVVEAYDRSDAHKIAAGTLLTIDNQIDTTTGTAKLKAVFENADNSLFPNQFVNVRLILRQRPNAIVIPTAAIQSGTQGSFVFVVNPGPTPADKLQNQPGAASANGASGGSGHRGRGAKAEAPAGNAEAANDGSDASAGGSGGGQGRGGKGGHGGAPPCPAGPNHADAITVHVDFAIGTDSVITDGSLKAGQKVVVDGAEKLVDGGNVCPTVSRSGGHGPGPNGTIGAGSAAPDSTQQPSGVNNGTPQAPGQNGQQSNNRNTGNGGGNQ